MLRSFFYEIPARLVSFEDFRYFLVKVRLGIQQNIQVVQIIFIKCMLRGLDFKKFRSWYLSSLIIIAKDRRTKENCRE